MRVKNLQTLLFAICCKIVITAGVLQAGAALAKADDATRYQGLREDFQALSSEEQAEFLDFVAGNTVFVTYHEAGHMLVSELELPVLAQEEDAVDNLATVSMLAADTDDMDVYLTHAMAGWFLMSEEEHPEELRSGFTMAKQVADEIKSSREQGELPVTLCGSCSMAAIAYAAAFGGEDMGIAWFDAHPDLNTPETTTSGLFEGMALAAAAGRITICSPIHSPIHSPVQNSASATPDTTL